MVTTGLLDVGDGNAIHWETHGNPRGKPAVVLHGGPGGGSSQTMLRIFDLSAYLVVLFDQRGCGRSTPHAADPATDLSVNTTHHSIADIELLRVHLGIESWLVYGVSWGTTLGLAYAQRHPDRVSELLLGAVTTTGPREVRWITEDVGRLFPQEWHRLRSAIPKQLQDRRIVDAYAEMLADPDPAARESAAAAWCEWESSHVRIGSQRKTMAMFDDPVFRMGFARLVTHYWRHAAWLPEGELLREAHRLRGIPGVLVHGGLDLSGPPDIAWQLAQVWTDAELTIVEDEGHGGPVMFEILAGAAARFVS